MNKPPPKPPRTFGTEDSKDWSIVNGTSPHGSAHCGHSMGINSYLPSVDENSPSQSPEMFGLGSFINGTSQTIRTPSPRFVGPPKPPRTFEYVMVDTVSYSYDLNYLSSPDDCLSSPVEQNGLSNSIICTSFVDNSNPIKVNTKPCMSRSSTVTYLQDRSCLTLCNGFYDPKITNSMHRSSSYKSSNSYSRCFSEERISVNKASRNAIKFEQKSFSLGRNADLKRDYKSEVITSSADHKVNLRHSRGNRNKSKRQAMYWDEDETSRLLQFSTSCPDIPDTSLLDSTKELDNGVLETWL